MLVSGIVLSKDPVLRYQVGTKKMKTSRYQVFFKYPGRPGSWPVRPYDFRDAENADGISDPVIKTEFTV